MTRWRLVSYLEDQEAPLTDKLIFFKGEKGGDHQRSLGSREEPFASWRALRRIEKVLYYSILPPRSKSPRVPLLFWKLDPASKVTSYTVRRPQRMRTKYKECVGPSHPCLGLRENVKNVDMLFPAGESPQQGEPNSVLGWKIAGAGTHRGPVWFGLVWRLIIIPVFRGDPFLPGP